MGTPSFLAWSAFPVSESSPSGETTNVTALARTAPTLRKDIPTVQGIEGNISIWSAGEHDAPHVRRIPISAAAPILSPGEGRATVEPLGVGVECELEEFGLLASACSSRTAGGVRAYCATGLLSSIPGRLRRTGVRRPDTAKVMVVSRRTPARHLRPTRLWPVP